MKNKGYTLLELLGVIVILSVLVILVFPSVINFIKKANDTKDSITNDLIISAAEDYINDNSSELYITSGDEHCVSIEELIGRNYLDKSLIEEGLYTSKSIKVTYTDKYNYELVNSGDCKSQEIVNFLRNYTPVEYIESTGTQYIDTGILPSETLNFKIKAELSNAENNRDGALLGSRSNNSSDQYICWYNNLLGKPITTMAYRDSGALYDVDYTPHILEFKDKQFLVDDIIKTTITITLNPVPTQNIYLFGFNQSGIIENRTFLGKIYYLQMSEGDMLIRNMIPCYRKSDNVIGMYDLVEGKFYTNAGTGEFLKGEEVEIK